MELRHQPVQALGGGPSTDFPDNFAGLLFEVNDRVHECFALNQSILKQDRGRPTQPQLCKRIRAFSADDVSRFPSAVFGLPRDAVQLPEDTGIQRYCLTQPIRAFAPLRLCVQNGAIRTQSRKVA